METAECKYIKIRVNNKTPERRRYYESEHKISYWFWRAGYSRGDIAKVLECSVLTLPKYLKNPSKYLTVSHIERICNRLEIPFLDCCSVIRNGQLP